MSRKFSDSRVQRFHDAVITDIRNSADNRDLAQLTRLGQWLRTIADNPRDYRQNAASGLVTYARTCYRNVKSQSLMTPLPSAPTQPLPKTSLPPKRGYTVVHAHYRKIA